MFVRFCTATSFACVLIFLRKYRQKEVKEEISRAYSVGEYGSPTTDEIVPFIVPIVHPSLKKFIYVSPNVIMKVGFLCLIAALFKFEHVEWYKSER